MDPFAQWTDTYRRFAAEGTELLWPSETLVRLLKGRYVPGPRFELAGRRVLDVGAGNGNNTLLCSTLGLRCHATEVTRELCDLTRTRLALLGCECDVRVGTNTALPFPDGTFDLLVSWNVLHYEQDEAAIDRALAEYRRVLAPGGRVYLSTTAPEHKLLVGAEPLPGSRVRVRRPDDFRAGQVFYHFASEEALRASLARHYGEVNIGRTRDHLMTETLDWWIACAVRA